MTQTIDPDKLKAAAEYLEWVLKRYPNEPVVCGLLDALFPLIEDAKAEKVLEPTEKIPCRYNFADGAYRPFDNPDVDEAYVAFAIEMEGGLTEDDKKRQALMEARWKAMQEGAKS